MNYEGKKTALLPGQMATIAEEYGLMEPHVRTVIQVETSSRAYNSVGWPDFLFEPHKFYQNVPKAKLQTAIDQGLAYKSWKGPGSYPKTPQLRVEQFLKAAALDETAAIESASWGLGQIMGSECEEAGYPTPQAMLQAFMDSEEAQIRGMLNLIKKRGLDKDLHNFPNMAACRHFALRYNGAGYAKNNYHVKLQQAYNRLMSATPHLVPAKPLDDVIRYGDQSERVRDLQKTLIALGYDIGKSGADADYGPATRRAVVDWKGKHGLPLIPDVGPSDLAKMKGG